MVFKPLELHIKRILYQSYLKKKPPLQNQFVCFVEFNLEFLLDHSSSNSMCLQSHMSHLTGITILVLAN